MTSRKAGLCLALTAAVISGIAIFTNAYGVKAFGEATVYTTAKNLVAAVVLGALLLTERAGRTRPLGFAQWGLAHWGGPAAIAVIGGSVPFILFFKGLATTSASDAAFIQKSLVGAIDVTALLVPAAIITALLQAGVQGKALAPQWPGLALVAAGAAVMALAVLRERRPALAEAR